MWQSQSLDLNPLDYGVWSVLQDGVRADSHPNFESLKARIVAAWEALQVTFIVKTRKSFRTPRRGRQTAVTLSGPGQSAVGCVSWSRHCFDLLLNIHEPVEFVCEILKSPRTCRAPRIAIVFPI